MSSNFVKRDVQKYGRQSDYCPRMVCISCMKGKEKEELFMCDICVNESGVTRTKTSIEGRNKINARIELIRAQKQKEPVKDKPKRSREDEPDDEEEENRLAEENRKRIRDRREQQYGSRS
eukprot:GILJ01024846.1.p1 GENE.GILJ01024846.1~~GILJ01024846.1.p1  ORF type:complete len:120 (+),score=12.08 GILJ01024846.1:189-548(+)